MRLKDLVKVDSRFEKSVNLYLDLYSDEKIDGYIPTRSSVAILGDYINEVCHFSGRRATVLIGPYGKGKSHLLLVLMSVLGKTCGEEKTKNLIQRISAVNVDVGATLSRVYQDGGKFLPVIITPGTGTLNQAFMKGLTFALQRSGLQDVVPDNYYAEAIKMLRCWEEHYPATYKAFCTEIGASTADEFISRLGKFNDSAMQQFIALYPALTSGGTFNPIVDDEIVAVYKTVNRTLHEKYGYAGIYIIFDEFSKFIEGHPVERFAEDMKVLQDMCELCNALHNEQLHLTCVAHKSIRTYGTILPKQVLNAYKGVEGRLSEVLFVVSSQNSYELIADAVAKTPAFGGWITDNQKFLSAADTAYALKIFRSLFDYNDYLQIIAEGCYPLTPVAAMLLLSLSEKIAQNERTIFTFIAGREPNGLAGLITASENDTCIGADAVYDYFVPLFEEDTTAVGVHHEWLKTEFALSRTNDSFTQQVLKAIAVVRMVNMPEDIPVTKEIIALALGAELSVVHDAFDALIGANLLEYKTRSRTYEFKNNIGVDVDNAIDEVITKRFLHIDIGAVLTGTLQEKYILPKKHNQEFCITRYFNYAYMTETQFLKLQDRTYLQWNNAPDGVVIFLLADAEPDVAKIEAHLAQIADRTMVVCTPHTFTDCTNTARRFLAVEQLLGNSEFIEGNLVIKRELENIRQDLIDELNTWFYETYYPIGRIISADGITNITGNGINRAISDICDDVYYLTPRINHELINRHSISAQVLRARNSVLSDMLYGRDTASYETGTSAESTIFRATMRAPLGDNGLIHAKQQIADFINTCVDRKKSFSELVTILTSAPYGMRKGVLAFYILDSLLQLSDTPVLYLNAKEVSFDVETINNLLDKPADYFLFVEPGTAQKNAYITGLGTLFADYNEYCREADSRNRYAKITCLIQAWYRALPQASVSFSVADTPEQNIREIQAFRRVFSDYYLNPHDVLFVKLPAVFHTVELKEVLSRTEKVKHALDSHIHTIKKRAIEIIRDTFKLTETGDFKLSLQTWYDELSEAQKNSVYTAKADKLMRYIKAIQTNDAEEIAGKIVAAVSGIFIEDWKGGSEEAFTADLQHVLEEIGSKNIAESGRQKIQYTDAGGKLAEKLLDYDSAKLSTTGTFFKSALEDMLEEYDGIMESTEKIGILMDAISKMMQ